MLVKQWRGRWAVMLLVSALTEAVQGHVPRTSGLEAMEVRADISTTSITPAPVLLVLPEEVQSCTRTT